VKLLEKEERQEVRCGCEILEGLLHPRQRWQPLRVSAIFRAIMLRRVLLAVLVVLLGLVIAAKARSALRTPVGPVAGTLRSDRTLPDRRPRAPLDLPAGLVPMLDSFTRAGVRVRLGAEPERQYLDSLFSETDSIVRHWPAGSNVILYAIVPGGPDGFRPEMVTEVRWALDTWHPAAVGLRFSEAADTAGATFVVRWADTLEADRAGVTDVTWDKAGRIRRVEVYLATRSPSSGRPFAVDARRAVVLHEIGHALGLPHSSRPGDVMFPVATETALSDRDRFSLRLLYEFPTGWIGTVRAAADR